MRCLYCGEPLSLLRKLTGKAEFCSEAHREAYQEEFNSLALQRLASQPKHQRRPSPFAPAPPEPIESKPVPQEASEPFAGLPFPDDAEDLEPIFDPDFATSFAEPPPPAIPEPEPPPMWSLLPNGPPRAAGETPPSYSFPLWLEEYPRECLMTNGIFPPTEVGAVPFSGYVDLPEPMDDEAELPGFAANERIVPSVSYAWELPPAASATSHEYSMPSAIGLAEFTFEIDTDSTLPEACALGIPETHHLSGTALCPPVAPTLRHQAPLAEPIRFDETDAYAVELDALLFHSRQEPWSGSGIPMWMRQDTLVASDPALSQALALPEVDDQLVAAADGHADAKLPIPECDDFDAARSLVAPQFVVTLHPAIVDAALLELELSLDHETPQNTHSSPLPFAGVDQPWSAPEFGGTENLLAPAELFEEEVTIPAFNETFGAVDLPLPGHLPAGENTIQAPRMSINVADCQLAAAGGEAASSLVLESELEVSPAEWTPFSGTPFSVSSNPPVALYEVAPFDELVLLDVALPAVAPIHEDLPVPEQEPEPAHIADVEPIVWADQALVIMPAPIEATPSALAKVRVKDFAWPEFAAGCESLFTPDQPFRFHEIPFVQRGITDTSVGAALECDIIQGLMLPYADDRFETILHPAHPLAEMQDWLNEESSTTSSWPKNRPSPTPTAFEAAGPSQPPPAPEPQRRPADPPSSWQQAARAMYEGEQQVPREPHVIPPPRPEPELKHVTAVPVIAEPLTGTEIARVPPPEPPAAFVKGEPPEDAKNRNRTPANDQPQFEWRREQPHQAPPPHQGGSTVSVNTTIIVDGNADGVVVENAIRVSLGQKNKKKEKEDAIEKFAEGEELDDSRVQIAPPEDLPAFVAEEAEIRAILQPVTPLAESIQWPKFSVTPMRRRIAFGPPARGAFFGGSSGTAKTPPPEAKPLPPKKSVGYLFKKLTNS